MIIINKMVARRWRRFRFFSCKYKKFVIWFLVDFCTTPLYLLWNVTNCLKKKKTIWIVWYGCVCLQMVSRKIQVNFESLVIRWAISFLVTNESQVPHHRWEKECKKIKKREERNNIVKPCSIEYYFLLRCELLHEVHCGLGDGVGARARLEALGAVGSARLPLDQDARPSPGLLLDAHGLELGHETLRSLGHATTRKIVWIKRRATVFTKNLSIFLIKKNFPTHPVMLVV